MLLKDEGFVIRHTKYGEKSLIGKVITKSYGLVNLIYSRSSKKKTNYFHPLNSINIVFYHSKKSTIYRIKEVSANPSPLSTHNKIIISSLLFFIAEFLDKTIKEEGKNERLYWYIDAQLKKLYSSEAPLTNYHLNFVFDLLPHLGIEPNIKLSDRFFNLLDGCSNNLPDTLNQLDEKDFKLLKRLSNVKISLSRDERERVLDILINYVDLQIGSKLGAMKSRDVLKVVFE